MKRAILTALAFVCLAVPVRGQGPPIDDINNRLIRSRAIEAVIWGMPAVNYDLMLQAFVKMGGMENQVVYWSRPSSWKNQTLTPNPDTIYLMPFISTESPGPMVLEIPPVDGGSITGTIMDSWQGAFEDIGPAGVDKGQGGKYVILPPGYAQRVPDGYIVLPSATNMAYALLRSNVKSGSEADVAKAVAYGKRIKLYPLSQAANPAPTVFVDAIEAVYDSTIPYDVRFFESLNRFVQREPWLDRDKAMIDQLKAIGIEQGKPFRPSPETQKVLGQAAGEARSWLDHRYEGLFSPRYYENGQWALPVAPDVVEGLANSFSKPGVYPIDDRGTFFSFAFASVKHLGSGQFYLVAIRDKAGKPFEGANSYRVTVPANAPVTLYWSATAYDGSTHALIRDTKWSSRASTSPGLQANADGSVDVFFGPTAPAGKETNWVPTQVGRKWEVMFRFYGPQKPLFDKTWRLPDVEQIAAQ